MEGTELGLRLSTRPNIAFVHCRHCHRPHLASSHKIFCPHQTESNANVTNKVVVPLAFMFFPRAPIFTLHTSSFPSLIDRPPTPFRHDIDEESLEEDDEKHWVDVTPPTPPNENTDSTAATTTTHLVSSEAHSTTKATSSYHKWIVSFRPWP